jgi:hypothetical protein
MWQYVALLFVALVVMALVRPIEKPAPASKFEDHNGRAVSESDFKTLLSRDAMTNARLEAFAAAQKRALEKEEVATSPGK